VRGVATVLVLVALLAGTAWGEDDHFPFGPFRMFSRTTKSTGRVTASRIEAVTADGTIVTIGHDRFGLRRAEVEGQLPRFRRDPALLRHLADAYDEFNPDGVELVELRVVNDISRLTDGRVTSRETRVVATWARQ
jgi:hypothetical protein